MRLKTTVPSKTGLLLILQALVHIFRSHSTLSDIRSKVSRRLIHPSLQTAVLRETAPVSLGCWMRSMRDFPKEKSFVSVRASNHHSCNACSKSLNPNSREFGNRSCLRNEAPVAAPPPIMEHRVAELNIEKPMDDTTEDPVPIHEQTEHLNVYPRTEYHADIQSSKANFSEMVVANRTNTSSLLRSTNGSTFFAFDLVFIVNTIPNILVDVLCCPTHRAISTSRNCQICPPPL